MDKAKKHSKKNQLKTRSEYTEHI